MKAIMISINPGWVEDILNGEKTIEFRKTMPKCELPVEVYIYVSQIGNLKNCLYGFYENEEDFNNKKITYEVVDYCSGLEQLNGKVVAKFTLNKVVEYEEMAMLYEQNSISENAVYEKNMVYYIDEYIGELQSTNLDGLLEKSCLTNEELEKYLGIDDRYFYAWYIDNLQIFDEPFCEPKKLSDFGLKKAPRGWCYVEAREE